MSAITQLLLGIVSGEAAVMLAVVGWATRRLIKQLDLQGQMLRQVSEELGRHLAWHDGQERQAVRARNGQ